jgi:hypothetical protein
MAMNGKTGSDVVAENISHDSTRQAGYVLLVANGTGFRGVASLPLVILDDLLTS